MPHETTRTARELWSKSPSGRQLIPTIEPDAVVDLAKIPSRISSEGFEVGFEPSVVVADERFAKPTATTTAKDKVYAFIFDQKGAMAAFGIQGNRSRRSRSEHNASGAARSSDQGDLIGTYRQVLLRKRSSASSSASRG